MPRRFYLVVFVALFILLAGCRDESLPTPAPTAAALPAPAEPGETVTEVPAPSQPAEATAEPTAIPPTPTPPEPLAALVNEEPIYLAQYEKELARYEQARDELGLSADQGDTNYQSTVLDALIETTLIAQAAQSNGIVVTPEMVEARMAELIEASGGADNFNAWLEANQWSEDEFREALAAELVTEKMVEFVTSDVPFAVEQVHARYLQVDDPDLAQSLLDQIRAGADFAALAQQYSLDRITGDNGGDLGFFAQGSLLVPEVEAAAFALQPDEVSDVIAAPRADGTGTTYYIVQVIERDPERPLSADLRFTLLQEKFEAWLADQWSQAAIVRFVDAGA